MKQGGGWATSLGAMLCSSPPVSGQYGQPLTTREPTHGNTHCGATVGKRCNNSVTPAVSLIWVGRCFWSVHQTPYRHRIALCLLTSSPVGHMMCCTTGYLTCAFPLIYALLPSYSWVLLCTALGGVVGGIAAGPGNALSAGDSLNAPCASL